MFDNLQGEWDYGDIVGELAAVVRQCSHEDTGSRVDFAAAVAAAVVVVAAVVAVGAGVVAVEATD